MSKTKHGMHQSPEYGIWEEMKQRCLNPNNKKYYRYGGRGITVHPAFLNFVGFYAEVGPRPAAGYTIERLDNNRGYEPGNVAWRTYAQQNRNNSRNIVIEFNGKKQCLADWSIETGINWFTLWKRLFHSHWTIEKALTLKPDRARNKALGLRGQEPRESGSMRVMA